MGFLDDSFDDVDLTPAPANVEGTIPVLFAELGSTVLDYVRESLALGGALLPGPVAATPSDSGGDHRKTTEK